MAEGHGEGVAPSGAGGRAPGGIMAGPGGDSTPGESQSHQGERETGTPTTAGGVRRQVADLSSPRAKISAGPPGRFEKRTSR